TDAGPQGALRSECRADRDVDQRPLPLNGDLLVPAASKNLPEQRRGEMVQVSRDLESKPVSPERPKLPASAVGYAERQPTSWLQPLEAALEGFDRIVKVLEHHPRA